MENVFRLVGVSAVIVAFSGCLPQSGVTARGEQSHQLDSTVDTETPAPMPSPVPSVKPSPKPSPVPSPKPSPMPSVKPSPNPVPSVTVTAIEGLAPTAPFTACRLNVWQRNVPGKGFNNYDAVVYVPCDYNADNGKKYPLVISNHGRGGSTLDTATHTKVGGKAFEGFIKQLADGKALQSTYGAIVIAPDLHAVGAGGDFAPSATATDRETRLILDAIKFLKVDPKKIVVTGLSYGGALTEDMMINHQGLLAGAAPVAMQPPNKGNVKAANTCPFVHFPLWAAGNSGDGVFNAYEWTKNFDGGFKYVLSHCAGYVEGEYFRITVFNANPHGGWDEFYSMPATQAWLMSQTQP